MIVAVVGIGVVHPVRAGVGRVPPARILNILRRLRIRIPSLLLLLLLPSIAARLRVCILGMGPVIRGGWKCLFRGRGKSSVSPV